MAGTKASTFLAGFRKRGDGEVMTLWQTRPHPLVARQATVHNGAGRFFSDAARGRIKLSYRTRQYEYDENVIRAVSNGYSIVTELSIYNQRIPDTLLAALPGRPLREVIGYNSTPAFFASKFTTIVHAEMSDFPGSDALDLILGIKWYRLSRALLHLG